MKKKLAMLFVVIMILSCMPVMAATVPAGADAATETVTTQAATGWRKVGKNYRYYYAAGKYYKNCVKKIGGKLYGFNDKGKGQSLLRMVQNQDNDILCQCETGCTRSQ